MDAFYYNVNEITTVYGGAINIKLLSILPSAI